MSLFVVPLVCLAGVGAVSLVLAVRDRVRAANRKIELAREIPYLPDRYREKAKERHPSNVRTIPAQRGERVQ